MTTPEALERFADLLVELGANVQPGQIVEVRADVALREPVRAIAASAYRRGARFVDVVYHDPAVRRARILHAGGDVDFAPDWSRSRVLQLGDQRAARITLSPLNPPGFFDDLDPERAAAEPYPQLPEYLQLVRDRTTNWLGAAGATAPWARLVHPELEEDEAVTRLWGEIFHLCRLDEADPLAAWEERFAQLARAAGALNERRFDSLHFEGPGTDLTIGLMPSSSWQGGPTETADGLRYVPNLPTEEIFTAPDPQRAEGPVRATKPFVLSTGALVEGFVARFEGGRAVQLDATAGAEAVREYVGRHENADRLGEIALVDREGRVGRLDTVFFNTLLDENAASHLALGSAYVETVAEEDRARINQSPAHADFMFGGDDVDVTGITRDGERVPVLRGGAWQV